jgi:hypothetical protein
MGCSVGLGFISTRKCFPSGATSQVVMGASLKRGRGMPARGNTGSLPKGANTAVSEVSRLVLLQPSVFRSGLLKDRAVIGVFP